MKARSAKAKGSRLEKRVAEEYRKIGIEAWRMPLSGAVSHMKGDIRKKTYDGWVDECKNAETVKLREWWQQTLDQRGKAEPVLHISANHRPIITVIRSDKYYDLMKELDDTGQPFIHKLKKISKKRFNLWDEWNDVWNSDELGDPILHIEPMDLTVMQLEHYMEIRECLL
jgi:Holliday junction resolvase